MMNEFYSNSKSRIFSAEKSKFQDSIKPEKSARKKLLLLDPSKNDSDVFIDESVLQEICYLSPTSSRKKSVQNSDFTVSSDNGLSSPLHALSLRSPRQRKTELKYSKEGFSSPRKRVLNEINIVNLSSNLSTPEKKSKFKENGNTEIKENNDGISPYKKSKVYVKDFIENTNFLPVNDVSFPKSKISPEKKVVRESVSKAITRKSPRNIIKNTSISKVCNLKCNASPVKNSPSVLEKLDTKNQTGLLTAIKHALHNSIPDNLVGRDTEKNEISSFIEKHGTKKVSGSLYISGAPGTGKTACLARILANTKICHHVEKSILINCMALQTATKVYQRVAKQLGAKSEQTKSFRSASNYIENALTKKGSMILLVLDEMDQLDSKNQEVLYKMFGWTSLKNSRLILIGIANSLNLTDRILPRLQVEGRVKPTVMNFKPYNKEELISILQDRVQTSQIENDSSTTVINSAALQFCARKVAATTGDARKALDICRRAVEMLEIEKNKKTNVADTSDSTLPKVSLLQISRLISGVEGSSVISSNDDGADSDDAFPLQQKLLVCTLILLCKKIKCKEAALGKLHEHYVKICNQRQVSCVNQSEFFSLCQLVQSRGIISVKKAKQLRQSQVKLTIQENDVEYALKGKALLSSILQSDF